MPSYPEILTRMFDLQKFGMKFGLESMASILAKLGNPQEGGRFIHVAGTNGKGSTAAMLASMLSRAGLKTGLYTSPHLVTFRERIKLDGLMISEADVGALAAEIWPATDPAAPPTFFEFVTAMALLWLKRKGADLSVMETGLGGRLDSTNVLSPIAAAITNVSLEHTEHLGGTIAEIAFEKAGIIKPGVPVVLGAVSNDALRVIEARAKEVKSGPVSLLGRDFKAVVTGTDETGRKIFNYNGPRLSVSGAKPSLAGPCQVENAAVALALIEAISPLFGDKIDFPAALPALADADWPGRAETFPPGAWPPPGNNAQAPLILDGAHNPAGAGALAKLLADTPHQSLHLVVGVMADKDVPGVLGPILPLAHSLYLTRPAYHRASTPEALLKRVEGAFGPPAARVELFPALPGAIEAAALNAAPGDLVVVSGSLFTVGEARAFLIGAPVVESN